MLVRGQFEEKDFISMLNEAMMQIPLYSKEWTNYNASDPGITILENLTAFEALQQHRINEITPAIRKKLLKMAGFEGKKGKCARMLLASEKTDRELVIAPNQKFMLGGLCYETNRKILSGGNHITGVWGKREETYTDYSVLIDRELPKAVSVFGKKPKEGDCLYFGIDKPVTPGEEIIFYVTVADAHNRNDFDEKEKNAFASLEFECYTSAGFVPVHVKDLSRCFLVSGEIRMRMPMEDMQPCPELPDESYCIRVRLTYADYDVAPRLLGLQGFLFEVWQKDSRSAVYTFQKANRVAVSAPLVRDGYVQIFCREEKSGSYRKYEEVFSDSGSGRFYRRNTETEEDGQEAEVFYFDKRRYGFGPERLKNAVRIVAYDEEMMRRYALEEVLGYDDQEMKLPAENIVPDSFCIIAERTLSDGEKIYDFVRPGKYGEQDLTYYLLEEEGKIVIEDAGQFIGAKLYMASCSVTKGSEGNVRENGHFVTEIGGKRISFFNPGPGTGGCFRESLYQVKERFLEDLERPYTAVTASDYERIAAETPGLCIKKVKAVIPESYDRVRVVVMPDNGEEFPGLSETYKNLLQKRMEESRLLCTKVEIIDPAYLAVNISGVLYIKQRYENETGQIEKVLREKLSMERSGRNFGDPVKFDEVFHILEQLDCVEFIYELSMFPENPELGRLKENDIYPVLHCLCYAGDISFEIRLSTNS